jgi:ferrous iron transport protein A
MDTGHEAVIRDLNGGKRFVSRASAMGFTPKTPIVMLQNTGKGPLLVYLRDTQVAIGRSEAKKIEITGSEA